MSIKETFASHIKAKFWSPKNIGLPSDYALNSHKNAGLTASAGMRLKK